MENWVINQKAYRNKSNPQDDTVGNNGLFQKKSRKNAEEVKEEEEEKVLQLGFAVALINMCKLWRQVI